MPPGSNRISRPLGALCVAALAFSLHCNGTRPESRPNFVVIVTDDHGYADLSAQGFAEDVRTPHIDALAASGVRMTSGYVTAPQCVPSRAGLLTGRYQGRFGVESEDQPLGGFEAQDTFAGRLRAAGYATGIVGKWHLGHPQRIAARGFEDVFLLGGTWANFDLDGRSVPPGPKQPVGYHVDVESAAARAFIARHRDEPFFLYLAHRAPHVPLDAPPHHLRRFPGEMPQRRRQALAMLAAVDDGVGGILRTLRELGIEERTLIFFLSDNGAPLRIHKRDEPGGGAGWNGSLNDPLNGEKGMLAEGGIRVPFIARWKGNFPGGRTFDHPVISLDIAPTVLAMAGLALDAGLDGVDLSAHLSGADDSAPHDVLYWRWLAQSAAREGRWKYLRGGRREYLFDLDADRGEQRNLIAVHPEVAERLRAKLERWSAGLRPLAPGSRRRSPTLEAYFDFYLDRKTGPPLPEHAARRLRRISDAHE